MRNFGAELERRRSVRRRPRAECELFLGARGWAATVVDASQGGIFVRTEAPVWPAALVRVRFQGAERYALVVHQRHVPQRLRAHLGGGVGLRWVRAEARPVRESAAERAAGERFPSASQ